MSFQVQGLSKAFGGLKAVNNVSFMAQGESVTSVIGPNGAGKTTLFNLMTGQLRADSGRVLFQGEDITELPPHKIVRRGIARSFQIVNIFPKLTVFENAQAALISYLGKNPNFLVPIKDLGKEEILEILKTVELSEHAETLAGTLSYGDQRILEIAIALASKPKLLLLDEPTAGMGPQETHATIDLIKKLVRRHGLTIILIEHDMEVVFSVSNTIIVMHQGEVIAQGRPEEVRENERVRDVYLGETEQVVRPPIEGKKVAPGISSSPILEAKEIHTYYGLSHILFGVSLSVGEGELVCLLGRNGAGKTTTLKSIIGLAPPRSGSIKFKGVELVRKRPNQIVRCGVCYVPADRRVYHDLTVRENLEVGKRSRGAPEGWTVEKIYDLFPALRKLDTRLGGHLSGGERQMLTIARALMGNPELLLLDEPTEGLAPLVVKTLEGQILKLKERGTSMLLAEQNVRSALRVSDRGYIINKGKIVYEGKIKELRESEEALKHLTL